MRYDNPELRERLAAEYALGTLPRRARQRFRRLMAADRELAGLVGDWARRLGPLDDATRAEEPPAWVWRAIERRIAATASPPSPAWFGGLAVWRGLALAFGAAAAALVLYIALFFGPAPAPMVVAVLAGHGGAPGWVAVTGPKPGEVSFAAVAPQPEAGPHAFELWAIAGGTPQPLGLLPQSSGSSVALHVAQLPLGGLLAVSLEPPGGSPTGLPTGPVLYQGKALIRLP
jgi:anti-sigma-K factor RskA